VPLVRTSLTLALNALVVYLAVRLVPGLDMQAGRSAPRIAVLLLVAGFVATALPLVAARLTGRPWARAGLVFAGEVVLLVVIPFVAPAVGATIRVGGLPGTVDAAAVVSLLLGGLVLTAGALAAAEVAARTDRAVRAQAKEASPLRVAVLVMFLVSGASGLMYEVVWSRQLVLVFGNTTQAVSAILTGYFAGMAIGSVLGGRIADRVRHPLRMYGLLELALVVVVLITPLLFRGLHELYRAGFASLEEQPGLLALVRYGLALLALAPATILMGATLPTLSRYLAHRRAELGTVFGRLYAANTVGAVIGTLLAGFVLIELVGLTGTLVVGVIGSGAAGVAAILLNRRIAAGEDAAAPVGSVSMPQAEAPSPATTAAGPGPVPASTVRRLAFVVAFVSGLTSLGYQMLWTRMLASGSGNTTYVFTAILTVFLVGIALGAALVARQMARRHAETQAPTAAIALLGAIQVFVAAIAMAGLVVLSGQVADLNFVARVIVVVLPATLAMGVTLPLASSLVGTAEHQIGRDAGLLLGANTIGTIGGTFIVPFVLIPAIGSGRSVVLLALVNLALGAVLVARGRDLRVTARRLVGASAAILATLGLLALVVTNPLTRSPGANGLLRESVLLADAEDEIASVQAGGVPQARRLLVGGTGMTHLTADAKVMTYLPLITRPDARRLLVICFGMGSSYRSGLVAGLETDGVELVPSVRDMFGFFYDDAAAVLDDPTGQLIITDGRNYAELTDRTYDLIVVDPPPPIESSGTSVLYSKEFYEAAAERLGPDGVMMEWMPYGQSVDEFRSHVKTFAAVFPETLLAFGPMKNGVYMLGSEAPMSVDPANVRSVLERPGVLEDLVNTPDSRVQTADEWASILEGVTWIEDEQVRAFGDDAAILTDDRPATEYFLLRRLFGASSPAMNEENLRAATPAD
jgi:spermidine synthase